MKFLSAALSSVILLLSPGVGSISAFAQVVAAPVRAASVQVPALGAGLTAAPALTPTLSAPGLAPSLAAPTLLPAAAVSVPAARAAVIAAPAAAAPVAAQAAAPSLALARPAAFSAPARAAVEAAAPEATADAPAAFKTLAAGARAVGRAAAGQRAGILESFFSGARVGEAENAAVEAAGAERPRRSGLEPLSPAALEAQAVDAAKPLPERLAAVDSVATLGGDAAHAALGRIADANPQGGAEDYEVHRAALKVLAERFNDVRSLRPVSRAHADAILAQLADKKPLLAAFDYDDTLEAFQKPASRETAAALKAAADAGVDMAILTDRNAVRDGGISILDSLAALTAEEKSALTIAARAGGEMVVYDKRGRDALLERMTPWTDAERQAVREVAAALVAKYGAGQHQGKTGDVSDFAFYQLLPIGTSPAALDEAAELARAELAKRGLTGLHIVARPAKNPEKDPPYVQVSKANKARGMGILRAQRAAYERLADLLRWGLPAKFAPKALGLLKRVPEAPVPAARVLAVGDQFFAQRATDADMTKAAPGALSIAVGGKADPRLPNVFVWPSEGHAASMELLGALAKRPDSGFNKKAIVGMFIARSLSIASFVLTAIAYPFVAAPAVGWAAYGTLMALGPLAAIATGPLNGSMSDRFSARGVHVFNMLVRAALAMALPAFSYFGVLNFWTLLLASIGNGWALSTIMTAENAWVRRLAGRHQNAVQALLSVNFVGLQVLLGLILGVGSIVDKVNPVSIFLITAALHAFVITPLFWFTMPKDHPQGTTAPKQEAKTPLGPRAAAFAKRYWKEALLTAASVGIYLFTHSTLPVAAALCWWVFQTDTSKALRRGDYRQVSQREKEIEARLAEKAGADDAEARALKAEQRTWKGRQMAAIVQSAAQAAMTYPFQNYALPLIATLLVGAAGKGLLLGKLMGAMYFGTLIANSSQVNLPELRLPLVGRIPGQRIVQGVVLAMAGAWVYTSLLPGSLLAAAAAVAAAAGLTAFAGRVTARGWVRMLGAGLSALTLPAAVWFFPHLLPFLSIQNALFIAMLVYGLFTGPSGVSLNIYQQNNTDKKDLGKVMGTGSSFFNTSNSLGYGLLALAAGMFTPAFPMMFLPMGALYLLGGLYFWSAPKRLPGLPATSFKPAQK